MDEERNYQVILWVFLIISTLAIFCLSVANLPKDFSLPLIMIFGVIDVFIVLSVVGKSFSKTNLACKDEALGLPSGSIRALIALSLIVIFAIMAIFMYTTLQETALLIQVPGNQSLVLGNGTIISDPNGISVWTTETSQAQKDFSTQVLTTVSTLVVALAGFYFGTKSVAQAQKSEEPPEGRLNFDPSSPANLLLKGKPEEDKLAIKVKTTPENEAIDFEIKDDKGKGESGTIIRSLKQNEFVFTPPTNITSETKSTLKFWMTKYPADFNELEIKIIPAPKTQPSADEKIKATDEELTILTQRKDGINAQIKSKKEEKSQIEDKRKNESDDKKKKTLTDEITKIEENLKSLEPKLKEVESQIEKKNAEKKELEAANKEGGSKPKK